MVYTNEELKKILELHQFWLNGEEGGVRANLRGANLCGADLCGANLRGADLTNVRVDSRTSGYFLSCPEKGSYIGYKKCKQDRIVELLIPEDALRSSATTRKCRASKAKVISITSFDGSGSYEEAVSNYDPTFVYHVRETIEVSDFDTDRWNECSGGIHHFITREEAVLY